MLTAGKRVSNFLIHPSVRKAVHGKYQQDVFKVLENLNFIILQQFLYKIQNLSKRLFLKLNRIQHSRMFGYDRDAGLMKVFIDEHLYKLNNAPVPFATFLFLLTIRTPWPAGFSASTISIIERKTLTLKSSSDLV